MKTVRHFEDLGFSVIAEPHENGCSVSYVVYDIFAEDDDGMLWTKEIDGKRGSYYDGVRPIEDADVFLHGYVKWDGCSNWHIDEQDRVMIHRCGRRDLANLGAIMLACFDMTKELIPDNFYSECAE